MPYAPKSIRPFIGSKDYQQSRNFYKALGFEERVLGDKMCLFKVNENLGFYLQDAYVADWVDNSMIVLEVEDLDAVAEDMFAKALADQFPGVRFSGPKQFDWGRELYMHDPAGVLWHFCEFRG
jgi:hypothetical protein